MKDKLSTGMMSGVLRGDNPSKRELRFDLHEAKTSYRSTLKHTSGPYSSIRPNKLVQVKRDEVKQGSRASPFVVVAGIKLTRGYVTVAVARLGIVGADTGRLQESSPNEQVDSSVHVIHRVVMGRN